MLTDLSTLCFNLGKIIICQWRIKNFLEEAPTSDGEGANLLFSIIFAQKTV